MHDLSIFHSATFWEELMKRSQQAQEAIFVVGKTGVIEIIETATAIAEEMSAAQKKDQDNDERR